MIIFKDFGSITVDIKLIKPNKCACYRQSRAITITSIVAFYEQFTHGMKINGKVIK